MGDLSVHFSRHEFACNGMGKGICQCGFDTVDAETLEVLEEVRTHFGEAVTVNSGCRCDKYNKHVGGSPNSKHKEGRACDIMVNNVQPVEVYHFLDTKYPNQYGIGSYDTFTHIDTRGYKARW